VYQYLDACHVVSLYFGEASGRDDGTISGTKTLPAPQFPRPDVFNGEESLKKINLSEVRDYVQRQVPRVQQNKLR
jgi:hypothetical protein